MSIEARAVTRIWPVFLAVEVDATTLYELRERYRRAGSSPPSFTALIVKAIALGVRELAGTYPEINSMLCRYPFRKRVHRSDRISAAVAMSREEASGDEVVLGVIEDPERTPLTAITERLRELAGGSSHESHEIRNSQRIFRLPSAILRLSMWLGRNVPSLRFKHRGTFSVTSVGKWGADFQFNPETGYVFSFGEIRDRPVVREGRVVSAPTFYLSVSFDHALANGKPGAILLSRIREILERADFGEAIDAELGPDTLQLELFRKAQ